MNIHSSKEYVDRLASAAARPNRKRGRPVGTYGNAKPHYELVHGYSFIGVSAAARALGMKPVSLGTFLNGRSWQPGLAERVYATFPALMPPELVAHYGLGRNGSTPTAPVADTPAGTEIQTATPAVPAALRASTRT